MDYVKAFLVGGLLCLIGQILIDKTKLTPARILVSYVVIGVLLGAVGLYQPLVDWAGAGATVPLTGFGYGLAKGVAKAVEEQGICFEHMPSGIDTLCVVLDQKQLAGRQEQLVRRIVELTEPDSVEVHENLALIATVGRGMVRQRGTSARLFGALMHAGVNVRMIDQGSS